MSSAATGMDSRFSIPGPFPAITIAPDAAALTAPTPNIRDDSRKRPRSSSAGSRQNQVCRGNTFRTPCTRPMPSPCDQRSTMQPGIGAQVIQDERRNVLPRYASSMVVGEIRERPDRAAAGLVVQDGGTDEDPVQPAVSDNRFLPILVGVNLLQQKWKDHIVEEETAVSGTIAGAHPGDANQPSDMLRLHRVDERAGRRRKQRHLAERACRSAERADDRVLTFEGFAQHFFIADVTDDELGALQIARLLG